MHPLIREFLSFSTEEKKRVLKTVVAPYRVKSENVRLWTHITVMVLLATSMWWEIGKVIYQHTTGGDRILYSVTFYTFSIWSMFYWCVFVPLIDAMRTCIDADRRRMEAAMSAVVEQHKATLIENIRKASGRTVLSNDPISIVAATIEATDPPVNKNDPAVNPLRAALDGTLRPEHLSPPEDDTNSTGF